MHSVSVWGVENTFFCFVLFSEFVGVVLFCASTIVGVVPSFIGVVQ